MPKRKSRMFGSSSGVRVRATVGGHGYERTYPIRLGGVVGVPVWQTIEDAKRLHRRLGEALEYFDKCARHG